MIKKITMPSGGQTTDKSMVGKWLVKKGDKVNRGDVLLEIETDKATLSVESYAKGTVLDILVPEGEYASAGDIIAYVGDEKDLASIEEDKKQTSAVSTKEEPVVVKDQEEEDEYQPIDKSLPKKFVDKSPEAETEKQAASSAVKAMPNAKQTARENNVDLSEVAQFANKEIINKADVEKFMAEKKNIASPLIEEDTSILLTNMRKIIAKKMLESTQNIPSFQVTVDVDMTKCIELRGLINAGKDSGKVSFNDIIFKSMASAITQYPLANSSFGESEIIVHHNVNIGLAVSIDGGLVVPVCRNANKLTISEISKLNSENIKKARGGSLSPADMSGGTITLSNLGMYPVKHFTAILNPPEVCILAISQMEQKPVFTDGVFKAIPTMTITATFDHRVIDGAYGAQFLAELKRILENPALMAV